MTCGELCSRGGELLNESWGRFMAARTSPLAEVYGPEAMAGMSKLRFLIDFECIERGVYFKSLVKAPLIE